MINRNTDGHNENGQDTFQNSAGENPENPIIHLDVEVANRVNFASAQNRVPVLKRINLTNKSDTMLEQINLTMETNPPVIQTKTWIIDRLAPHDAIDLVDIAIDLDLKHLSGLNEMERGTVTFSVTVSEQLLHSQQRTLEFLAKDEWGGLADMDRLIAAYVSPNDAVVAKLLKDASILLEKAGHDGSMEGYQSGDPQRAWMIAGAIWSAATGMGLTYAMPPASFEESGQKVRSPTRIKREGLATCFDSTLLLAAAWEQAGLNPVVLFATGHAWAGVWITPNDFGQVTEPDVVAVRKAVTAGEFVPVETTLLCRRPSIGFEEAVEAGRSRIAEELEHEFLMAIDVNRARSSKIRPLANHSVLDLQEASDLEAAPAKLPSLIDFADLPIAFEETVPQTPAGRIERWQSKLLDLSLRNRLLNFKATKQTLACMVPDIGKLEDTLAADRSFKIYALKNEDPIGERKLPVEEVQKVLKSSVEDAFKRGQITVNLHKKDADDRLLNLYRKANSDLQEGGTNTLYLAVGFLRWQRENEEKFYRAPLLLLPIKLERKSARSQFKISHHEDEIRFNSTLLEFLKRDFDLSIPELQGELPQDASGVDVPLVLSWIRARVRDVKGFEVNEDLAISTFSFAKYLMWKDLVDRTDKLRNNRLVAHLVDSPDKVFERLTDGVVEGRELDHQIDPEHLFTPLAVDSSQLEAIVAASRGEDFVLVGPPGTGKSQTIANIISQCLAEQKTVLFVSEKAAALDVVYRRLQSHGLGNAVLELHSNKTDRKRVLAQLGRGWDRASGVHDQSWVDITKKLRLKRDQLNIYASALHTKGTQGFSVFDAISQLAEIPNGPKLQYDNKDAHDEQSYNRLLEIAEKLELTNGVVEGKARLNLVGNHEWSHAWEEQLIGKAKLLIGCLRNSISAGSELASIIGLTPNDAISPARCAHFNMWAERLNENSVDISSVPTMPINELRGKIADFKGALTGLAEANNAMVGCYGEENIARVPYEELDAQRRVAEASIWPISYFRKRRVRKLLQTYADPGALAEAVDIEAIRKAQQQLVLLQENPLTVAAGSERSLDLLARTVSQALAYRRLFAEMASEVANKEAFVAALNQIQTAPEGRLRKVLEDWQKASAELGVAIGEFISCGGAVSKKMSLAEMKSETEKIVSDRALLSDWVRWVRIRERAMAAGLKPIIDKLEDGTIEIDAQTEVRRAYARWWLPLALDASEPLRRFAYWEHEDTIKAFIALDEKVADATSSEIMRRLHHGLPARDGVPRKSELGVLKHQMGLKRPSMAIRSLLENLGGTFSKLAPCVLMSPLSIAQYLPTGKEVFDVVIFDEASQITTWDAIGAIARAKQSIIVGDPKQLPPTNFFGRSEDANTETDDTEVIRDLPSILEEVSVAGVPTRTLNWHYRSRDEALIAFSNHFYYDGSLVTFPAPFADNQALQFYKVDGTYARGASRTNAQEAKAIVVHIHKHLTKWLELPEDERPTLGVITFNAQQQGLIMDLLDTVRRKLPALEWFFSDDREEPVIVKNLENIQGDERDIILFSTTFAPDMAGKLTMNFGALNLEGGEKRLNVAITRARQQFHVFSSIIHKQIDLARTRARGVRDLKTFLHYAENGPSALPASDEGSLGPAENMFEEAVAEAFRNKGWEVRTQIGVSGFRVDLAVVNPDRAGAYLVGIECDGATYHSSATARDRDKLRQSVLEGLGWTILRIWSTDWFKNPDAVVERMHGKLENLLAVDRKKEKRLPHVKSS